MKMYFTTYDTTFDEEYRKRSYIDYELTTYNTYEFSADYWEVLSKLLFSDSYKEFYLCEALVKKDSISNFLLEKLPINVEIINYSKITNKRQDI